MQLDSLRDIRQFDYHFHWEKDEWYPEGGFREMGTRVRCPLELLCQDYAGALICGDPDFPVKPQWKFIGLAIEDEAAAWEIARPFVERQQTHPYLQASLRGFEILHGIPADEFVDSYWELSRRVRSAYRNGILGWLPAAYEKAHISRCLNIWTTRYATDHYDRLSDADQERERDLLPATFRFDYFLVLLFRYRQSGDIAKWVLEAIQDVTGEGAAPLSEPYRGPERYVAGVEERLAGWSFDDFLRYMDSIFDFFESRGVRNLKSACCYKRSLEFHRREEGDARAAFRSLMGKVVQAGEDPQQYEPQLRVFEDYVFFRAIELARQRGWQTIQVHTGHHNRKEKEEGRPIHLAELIECFPDVNFVLLHGGKEFYEDEVKLAAQFPNVILDFTWLPILSPELASKAMARFLGEYPYRTAAGLDMANIEGSAGMSAVMREALDEVLSALVHEGKMSEEDAPKVARSVLCDLPQRLFGSR